MENSPNTPEIPDEVLYPDIFACARQGNTERLKYLLDEEGVDPNLQGRNGTSALMLGVGRGHTEVVSILLQHGSLTDLRDRHGFTAILKAADAGKVIFIQVLTKEKIVSLMTEEHFRFNLFISRIPQASFTSISVING